MNQFISISTTHMCPLKGVRVVLSPNAPSRAPGKTGSSGLIETQTRGQNVLKWTAMLYDITAREQRLFELLPRSHKKRYRWLGRRSFSVKIPHRMSIRHRPSVIANREEFGHWEGDTIVGYKHKTGLHTEVERVSRYACVVQIPHIRSQETFLAQLAIFNGFPQQARKSTTLDNGSENYLHTRLQEELGMQTYFADPYSSWQRGTNESTNGLIRRFFPKRTDFRSVSQEEVNDVVERLNNTPRRGLNYQTPREVFSAYILQSVRIDS
jgi:IS30 family transposase